MIIMLLVLTVVSVVSIASGKSGFGHQHHPGRNRGSEHQRCYRFGGAHFHLPVRVSAVPFAPVEANGRGCCEVLLAVRGGRYARHPHLAVERVYEPTLNSNTDRVDETTRGAA